MKELRGVHPIEVIDALPTHKLSKNLEINNVTCCICLTDMEEGVEVRQLPCMHYFHKDCIDQWLLVNKTCPVDKRAIDEPQ